MNRTATTIDFIGKGVILFVASLTVLAGAIIAPSLPQLVEHLISQGTPHDEAHFWGRMLLSVPALVILICAPIMGYIVDRFGRRRVMLIGLLLFAISGVWGGIFPTLPVLIISRLGLGLAVSMSMVTAITLVSDFLKGHKREHFMGYFSSAMSLGGIVYFILGGFVATLNWRMPFFIYLLSLPALALAFFHIPEPQRHDTFDTAHSKESRHHAKAVKIPFMLIGIIYVTALLNMASYYIIPTQLPFVLKHIGFDSTLHVGLTAAACSIGVFSISLFYGTLKDKFSHSNLFALGFLGITCGYSLLYFLPSYSTVVMGLFMAGLGFGLIMPNTGTWLMRIAPESIRGRVAGGMSSSINMGQFISPLVAYPIIAATSTVTVFAFFACITGILSLFYLFFRR